MATRSKKTFLTILIIIGVGLVFAMACIYATRNTMQQSIPVTGNTAKTPSQTAGGSQTDAAGNKTIKTNSGKTENEAAQAPETPTTDYRGEYSFENKYDDGSSESGTLDVIEQSANEITFNLFLVNYQLHTGRINKGKAKISGNIAVYENKLEFNDDDGVCRLKITFIGDSATIETFDTISKDASCGFGMNVIADGVYVKKSGSTPADYAKFAGYVPFGWQIKTKAEGDLNEDGISDAAIIAEDAIEKNTTLNWQYCANNECECAKAQNCARKLRLFLGKKDGSYELSLTSDKAILLANEGGDFGDPLEGVEISNGSVLLKFVGGSSYGGSSWWWDNKYRFRYQNDGWYLIGKTAVNYYDRCPNEVFRSVDTNYLTGKTETITGAVGLRAIILRTDLNAIIR